MDLKLCRCCLLPQEGLLSLFDEETGLLAKLLEITSLTLQVDDEDELLTGVCSNCSQKIIELYDFKVKCEFSDAILQKLKSQMMESTLMDSDDEELNHTTNDPLTDCYREHAAYEPLTEKENSQEEFSDCPEFNENVLEKNVQSSSDVPVADMQDAEEYLNTEPNSPVNLKTNNFRNETDDNTFTCNICLKSFKQKRSLAEHIDSKHYHRTYECNVCKKILSSASSLRQHKRRHASVGEMPEENSHTENHFVFETLDEDDTKMDSANQVDYKSRPKKMIQCKFCDKQYKFEKFLALHVNRSHGDKMKNKNRCTVCEATFYTKSELDNHFQIHSGKKPFECSICLKSFAQKRSLVEHIDSQHNRRTYECDICNKQLRNASSFQIHRKSHTESHLCTHCGKFFRQIGSLQYHMRKHTGEKYFQCEDCNKSFLTKNQLRKHQIVHTDERPQPTFMCNYCEKLCFTVSELKIHLRTHTGERPYACKLCDKRFIMKVHLTVHTRQHTGEKPYTCELCGSQFISTSSQKKHMRKLHGIKNISCHICGEKYSQPKKYKNHLQSVHQIVRNTILVNRAECVSHQD